MYVSTCQKGIWFPVLYLVVGLSLSTHVDSVPIVV